jgi:O-acetyl-ADP-ribose deacetylase (regulator of RNase III)
MATLQDIPKIILLCMEEKFITAFNEALSAQWPSFAEKPKIKITVLNEALRNVPPATKFQLVVSPANSYGRLDGAFDDAISRKFCLPHHAYDTLTHAAQKVLYERWRGFAPPGSCTLVPFPKELEDTNEWGCKWVAICPTMRYPDRVSWDREVVYECVWSLLCQVEGWNRQRSEDRIETILITPLATGVGAVSEQRWAAQFVLALKHFVDALERPERWSQLGWREIDDDVIEVEKTWKM